jgi:hypothetical protein
MTVAPDFTNGYPSAGEMIGPAWQVAWDLMEASPVPLRSSGLAEAMVAATGVKFDTARNLIRSAARYQKLNVEYRFVGKTRYAFYSTP